jgi:hypothetical protein
MAATDLAMITPAAHELSRPAPDREQGIETNVAQGYFN